MTVVETAVLCGALQHGRGNEDRGWQHLKIVLHNAEIIYGEVTRQKRCWGRIVMLHSASINMTLFASAIISGLHLTSPSLSTGPAIYLHFSRLKCQSPGENNAKYTEYRRAKIFMASGDMEALTEIYIVSSHDIFGLIIPWWAALRRLSTSISKINTKILVMKTSSNSNLIICSLKTNEIDSIMRTGDIEPLWKLKYAWNVSINHACRKPIATTYVNNQKVMDHHVSGRTSGGMSDEMIRLISRKRYHAMSPLIEGRMMIALRAYLKWYHFIEPNHYILCSEPTISAGGIKRRQRRYSSLIISNRRQRINSYAGEARDGFRCIADRRLPAVKQNTLFIFIIESRKRIPRNFESRLPRLYAEGALRLMASTNASNRPCPARPGAPASRCVSPHRHWENGDSRLHLIENVMAMMRDIGEKYSKYSLKM